MAMNNRIRVAIGSLVLSAAGLVAKVAHEGWAPVATVPTQGDVPTVCYGMTQRPDGTPVKLGDKCTPVEGLQRTLAYTAKADAKLRECVKVPLHQEEFDLLDDHAYQYGVGATCSSPIVKRLNAGDYAGACQGYLDYRFMTSTKRLGPGWEEFKWDANGNAVRWRFDCSTPGNRQCMGVWTRSKARFDKCMEVQ
jgi:lysozyme